MDNVKHKPGGGDKKIFNDRDYLRQSGTNPESLCGSGSQVRFILQNLENNYPVSSEMWQLWFLYSKIEIIKQISSINFGRNFLDFITFRNLTSFFSRFFVVSRSFAPFVTKKAWQHALHASQQFFIQHLWFYTLWQRIITKITFASFFLSSSTLHF